MATPVFTSKIIAAGQTEIIRLTADAERLHNTITVAEGSSGVVSIELKALFGQWETPEEPNTIDLSTHKSILFKDIALEAVRLTNGGAGAINIYVTQV